jgi:hypothetical protein
MFEDRPSEEGPRRKFHPVYLFLLIPYAAWAWVPFYNRIEPEVFGIPFFYWWQIFGIFLTAICIVPVYLHQENRAKGIKS